MLALPVASCATAAPPTLAPPPPPVVSYEHKLASILMLEDQRWLRDATIPEPEPPPPPPPPERRRSRSAPPVVVPPPPPPAPPAPDLLRLLGDEDPRIRRRVALAIGRVGLEEGAPPLIARLSDPEPEVRQMAAFALGLIGRPLARNPLVAALDDEHPIVKASAAEALGLIGDVSAAEPIARMAARIVESGALATPPGDEGDAVRDTPAGAVRLALFALARLKAYEALASVVLDDVGQPRVRWWPVAYALQRLEDARASSALVTLASDPHPFTRAFAVRGLGAMKGRGGVMPALVPLVTGPDRVVAIEAVRALGRLEDPRAAKVLIGLVRSPKADPQLRVEAVAASVDVVGEGLTELLIDTIADHDPAVRAGVLRALAERDPETFLVVLSGLDPDPDWTVRAALATALGTLSPEAGLPRLRAMLGDGDARVVPAVLAALVRLKTPAAEEAALAQLRVDDPIARANAARALGTLKSPAHAGALFEAYRRSLDDPTYVARAAILTALAEVGAPEADSTLNEALADRDWAVRLRAAELLAARKSGAADVFASIRPAPPSRPDVDYAAPHLVAPSVSTQFFIDTDRGTIQVELAVLDAPLTVDNFVALARRGFFDGLTFHRVVPGFVVQAGDPRGDSEGGPGYTIRDEINQRPHIRGALGVAIDSADTGGSQFYITHAPQPHLDAKYTVFGRVLTGMEVVDQLRPGDIIRRVRVWDGTP
jgi:HEAT repeat protein/cyclophilin family peptidyl-prolyl cis-trans isomerase